MSLVKVSPGQPFRPSAGAWNSFIDAAEYVRRRQSLGAGGQAVDEPDRLVVRAGWQERVMGPIFGVVRVMECYDNPALSPIIKCRLPGPQVGGRIGILQESSDAINKAPFVQIVGDSPVLYNPANGPVTNGDRLGVWNDFYAVPDPLGELFVVADLGVATALIPSGTWSAGARLALVRIGEDKAAPKVFEDADGNLIGAFRTVVYGGGYAASEGLPGEPVVGARAEEPESTPTGTGS